MKVQDKYYDEVFDFAGLWGMPSKCGLKIIDKGERKIVVVTELYQDNPGTSVTSAAGLLAGQVFAKKELQPAEVIYLECSPDTNSKLSFYDEEYFEVTFQWVNGTPTNPVYRKLDINEAKTML